MSVTSEIRNGLKGETFSVFACSKCGKEVVVNDRVAAAWCQRDRCRPRGKAGRAMVRAGVFPTSTVVADQIERFTGRVTRRCKVDGCSNVHDRRGYCSAHARAAV